ncbi:MAG: bifunctional RNase H/acid phosphatase [Micrococcaceae bacterium]
MTDLFQAMNEPQGRVLVVEADGASRGNPGHAAYGTVVKDQATGQVLAEDAGYVGVETNNFAEYRGLLSGLKITRDIDPAAAVEVFMDSKLVVEQMSGNWKIKHASMKKLAEQATELSLGRTISYQWIPREQNAHADRLANEALDAQAAGKSWASSVPHAVEESQQEHMEWEPACATEFNADKPWSMRAPFSGDEPTTTLILVRHGRTEHTHDKRFSGKDGSDPHLSEIGQDDAKRIAAEIAKIGVEGPWAHLQKPTQLVSSPMKRSQETAEAIGHKIGLDVELDDSWIEASFGDWEGLTLDEVKERDAELAIQWTGSVTIAPPGGESLVDFEKRSRQARKDLVSRYAGETIVSVSHATPIRVAVADAVGATETAMWRLLVSPASMSIVRFWGDEASDILTINSCSHLG